MAQMRLGRNRRHVEEALPVDGKALETVNLWGRFERSDDLTRSSGPGPRKDGQCTRAHSLSPLGPGELEGPGHGAPLQETGSSCRLSSRGRVGAELGFGDVGSGRRRGERLILQRLQGPESPGLLLSQEMVRVWAEAVAGSLRGSEQTLRRGRGIASREGAGDRYP